MDIKLNKLKNFTIKDYLNDAKITNDYLDLIQSDKLDDETFFEMVCIMRQNLILFEALTTLIGISIEKGILTREGDKFLIEGIELDETQSVPLTEYFAMLPSYQGEKIDTLLDAENEILGALMVNTFLDRLGTALKGENNDAEQNLDELRYWDGSDTKEVQ